MQIRNTPPGTDLHRRVHFWGGYRGRPTAAPPWVRCRRYVSRRRGEPRSSAAEANDDNTPMQIRNTHRVRICIGVFIFGGFTADGQWPPLRGCVAADTFLAVGASIARPRQRPTMTTRRCKSAIPTGYGFASACSFLGVSPRTANGRPYVDALPQMRFSPQGRASLVRGRGQRSQRADANPQLYPSTACGGPPPLGRGGFGGCEKSPGFVEPLRGRFV